MIKRLRQARNWVFDLDNTLYPAECDLFSQIDERMTRFVADFLQMDLVAAKRLQKQYYQEHGTTLNGLMQNHQMHPDAYLEFVHDIDHSVLPANPLLRGAISQLPGQKIVFTNGSKGHAQNVLAAAGLDGIFDTTIGIECTGFIPKPQMPAYDHLIESCDIDPEKSVFFEDLARNLLPAHEMGFVTVLVTSDKDWSHEPVGARPAGVDETHEHVHFAIDDLTRFLQTIPMET